MAKIGKFAVNLTRCLYQTKSLQPIRHMSACGIPSKSLVYKDYGEPCDVVQMTTANLDEPSGDQVLVKWLLSPVNPADINTIQGKYPSKPPLPAVAGNEGVGEIVSVGPEVKGFCPGDRVVPNTNNMGTWRTQGIYKSQEVMKISKGVGCVEASMLNVNPCTAYRMLKDFVQLKENDTVIQNGGNSAVGQMVIQLCKIWNLKSVNVIRDRNDASELKEHLCKIGATAVLTEGEVRTTDIFKGKLPKPKLALNCVCGKNATDVMRHLDHGGTMVTYGAMSREPLTVPASGLIFMDLSFKGFWMTRWTLKNAHSEERRKMIDELCSLFESKKLQAPPHKLVPFTQYKEAIGNALKFDGKTGVKYILDMSC